MTTQIENENRFYCRGCKLTFYKDNCKCVVTDRTKSILETVICPECELAICEIKYFIHEQTLLLFVK